MAARSGVKLVLDTLGIEKLQGSESCHRTVRLVGIYAIVVLDIRNDAGNEILLKEGHLVHEVLRRDGTVRHDYHHGLHLTLSQEVVEDIAGTTYTGFCTEIAVAGVVGIYHDLLYYDFGIYHNEFQGVTA